MPMLSKKAVNELRTQRLFRIIDSANGHHGFIYKVGLNEDPNEFSVRGQCVSGGLYFTDAENIFHFWQYGDRVAEIEIPENEAVFRVSQGPLKYRAKRIIVSSLYKKGDIIEKLIELGASKYCGTECLTNDIMAGLIDMKYLDARRMSLPKIMNGNFPYEKKLELIKTWKGAGNSLDYYNNHLTNESVRLIIDAGFKVPDQYLDEALKDCFYTAPGECKYLLDNANAKFGKVRVERFIRHGHVAIIRELSKRDMIPDGVNLKFEPYVSKDRRSEIRKLCKPCAR